MGDQSFLDFHGFIGDPFASTNSETEDLLEQYFVPPPYFASVIGSPDSPKVNVVFAPRGSGKTAQRRMIEQRAASPESNFLCLTYDSFNNLADEPYTLQRHHEELCRLLTVGILAEVERDISWAFGLSERQKEIVKICARLYVEGLSVAEYQSAMSSVKSLGDKAGELWRKYGGVVAAGVGLLMKKAGLDDVNISVQLANHSRDKAGSARYFYEQLVVIARECLDWESVYFLVDKVDETTQTTNSPKAAYELVHPLLTDLPTLEVRGVAFKFFLWDLLEDDFRSRGGRPDRVDVVTLEWTVDELADMLKRRLRAHSDNRIESFNQLMEPTSQVDAHLLIAYLSNGSPRDVIRMAGAVVGEHTRTSSDNTHVTEKTLYQGIRQFSIERSKEIYPSYMKDFVKISGPSFTINKLANDVFNVSNQAARSKVQKWQEAGAVAKIGEISNRVNKPVHHYAFTDFRIVLACMKGVDMPLLLDNHQLECSGCGTMTTSETDDYPCPNCGERVSLGSSRSLLGICTLDPAPQ